MKKKTLIISFVSIAFLTLITSGLLIYGAIQGVAFLVRQAGPQVMALQELKTEECRTAISQVANLQVWMLGDVENVMTQIGITCLGSYFKQEAMEIPESEEIQYEII